MAHDQDLEASAIAEMRAELVALRSGHDALRAEVVELRAMIGADRSVDAPKSAMEEFGQPEAGGPDLVLIKEAARRAGHSVDTLKRWCDRHAIGQKVGGRWYVDMVRYHAFRDGRAFRELSGASGSSLCSSGKFPEVTVIIRGKNAPNRDHTGGMI